MTKSCPLSLLAPGNVVTTSTGPPGSSVSRFAIVRIASQDALWKGPEAPRASLEARRVPGCPSLALCVAALLPSHFAARRSVEQRGDVRSVLPAAGGKMQPWRASGSRSNERLQRTRR